MNNKKEKEQDTKTSLVKKTVRNAFIEKSSILQVTLTVFLPKLTSDALMEGCNLFRFSRKHKIKLASIIQ